MDYERAKTYLKQRGQEHLLQYYDELDELQKEKLLSEIEYTNFTIVKNIKDLQVRKIGKLSPVKAVTCDDVQRRKMQFESVGINLLKENKVGAVLLAGGMGSRLGSSKPKGMFNIGETRELTIFEQQMNNIAEVTALTGRNFPLFIMTSVNNNEETVNFFKEKNFFGYPRDRVHFFIQDTAPACDFNGKVFLEEKYKLALTPNGNGGWYSSLINSGLGRIIDKEGLEWLNVYSVDNVLQRICDPLFIGATVLSGCKCAAKVVKKTCPEEKVGVLCIENGKPAIVEYTEIPPELAAKRDRHGELVFRFGVTLNYLFNIHDLNSTLGGKLPYHLARKAIPHVENGEKVSTGEPNGYKFETLVVDMVKLMGSCLAYEVDRNREFAPVKNREGVDSVETARALLKENGVKL